MNDTEYYEIINLGMKGYSLRNDTPHAYMKKDEYVKALNSKPDIVIIMLGTNDARFVHNDTEFVGAFKHMVGSFIELDTSPHVYVMTPPPVYVTDNKCLVNQKIVNNYYSKLIPDLARENGLPERNIIDVFNALGGK